MLLTEGRAQGPPVFTDTPIMLGLAGKGVRTFGHFQSSDALRSYTQVIAIPYNVGTDFQVGSVMRYVSKNPASRESQSGLGDLTIFFKQLLIQKDGAGKTFRALIKATPTIPVGNDNVVPPLGAGVWRGGLGLVAGYITTDFGIYLEVGHVLVEQRADHSTFSAALSVPVLPQKYPPQQINLSLDVFGTVGPERKNDVWLAPGLQWITGKRFLVEAGISLPLTEGDLAEQERTDFAFRAGLRYLFY